MARPEVDTSPPPDFALRYEWQAGSLPPPHHYEYAIHAGPGAQGRIVFRPDYAQHNPPAWTEPLPVTEETLAGLYRLLQESAAFTRAWRRPAEVPIGGSYDWLEVTAGGRVVRVPGQLEAEDAAAIEPVYQAMRELVPQALWARLMAQREAFVQAYYDREGGQ